MKFDISQLNNASVLKLYSIKERILINPPYQRFGNIWTEENKQLLIDSVLNEFDLPKFYFHDLSGSNRRARHDFAIIDGRQRLEALWDFIDGKFPLSEEFKYIRDPRVKANSLTYAELAESHPLIKQLFDAYQLSVFVVQTDDVDLIEEMFSRLNEAVPLNAAEKRNAFGGPLPKLVRRISDAELFRAKIKISNKRYQHLDLAAKLLYLAFHDEILDTKKVYLDDFFRRGVAQPSTAYSKALRAVEEIALEMEAVFTPKDKLLSSPGLVVLYFLLFRSARGTPWRKKLTRARLLDFERARSENRVLAAKEISKADYDLLEFDRLAQTPNDAYAIRFRLRILEAFIKGA